MSKTIRINKYLAQLGVASRRKADELIAQRRVEINGKTVTEMGTQVDPLTQTVSVDGVDVGKPKKGKKHYYALYKPKNVITTLSDPEKRPSVGDMVATLDTHVFPVGRLDFDAEGLLLLTNDGDVAHALMHPSFDVVKTYRVKVKGVPSIETMALLKKGVTLEDGFIKPTSVKIEKALSQNAWIIIKVKEGRKHLVKRIFFRVSHPVIRLIRTDFGPIRLKPLKSGQIRKLNGQEIQALQAIGDSHS